MKQLPYSETPEALAQDKLDRAHAKREATKAAKRKRERAAAAMSKFARNYVAKAKRQAEIRRFEADPAGYVPPEERAARKSAQQSRAAKIGWRKKRQAEKMRGKKGPRS